MDTKERIKKQFIQEYEKRDFSLITVKEICASTPVARTTFYSYYNNLDDVRCEIESDILTGLADITATISGGKLPDMDFSVYMDAVESYIKDHWTVIHAFLVAQPNYHFIRRWKDAIKSNFSKRYPEKKNIGNFDTIAEVLASTVISVYSYWMEHPETSSTKEIKLLVNKMLDSLVSFL